MTVINDTGVLEDLDFDTQQECDLEDCNNDAEFIVYYRHYHEAPSYLFCKYHLELFKSFALECTVCHFFAPSWLTIVERIEPLT